MKKTYCILILIITAMISSCSLGSKEDVSPNVDSGEGGSLARFTIVDDYLYTVAPDKLHTISLLNREHPKLVSSTNLGFFTETIFPYNNALLLGTDNGMYVFDIKTPATPVQKTFFQHIRSCDPVVAQNGYAYLTLNTANQRCFAGKNQLQMIDINDLSNPKLVKAMDLNEPKGLDINNDTLLVCDQGIIAFNVSDKNNPKELFHEWSSITNVLYNDIIWHNGLILAVATNGIYQYKLRPKGLQKISSILIQP